MYSEFILNFQSLDSAQTVEFCHKHAKPTIKSMEVLNGDLHAVDDATSTSCLCTGTTYSALVTAGNTIKNHDMKTGGATIAFR